MNFIRTLNASLERISLDEKLNPTHVSLYMALFHSWNQNRFKSPVSVNREEIKQICKIGSKHTYHKCLWDLHHWGYIEYLPSYNPMKGSKINMFNFDTGSEQLLPQDHSKNETGSEQVLPPSLNITKIVNDKPFESNSESLMNGGYEFVFEEKGLKEPDQKGTDKPLFNQILNFFKNENWPEVEAEKFFNYFESNGWKVGGKTPMKNWHAAARNWILNAQKFNKNEKQVAGNLNTTTNKNYGEPL